MLRYHFIEFLNAMISNGYCVHGISGIRKMNKISSDELSKNGIEKWQP
jgi:hypothetical protein